MNTQYCANRLFFPNTVKFVHKFKDKLAHSLSTLFVLVWVHIEGVCISEGSY